MANFIFDLDGTLVDSRPGIELSARAAFAFEAPELPIAPLSPHIGPGIRAMLALAYPAVEPALLDRVAARFRTHYDAGGWRDSHPYPGAVALLASLQAQGHRCFVATVKPKLPARAILEHSGLWPHLLDAVSLDSVTPAYPDKAASVEALLARHGLEPSETMLVGDGASDRDAALANGVRFIPAFYGFGGLASVDYPAGGLWALDELPAFLASRARRACPGCGEPSEQVLYANRVAPLDDLSLGYQVKACASCGLVFADGIPPGSSYQRYYQDYSKYDGVESLAELSPTVRFMASDAVRFLAPHLAPDARICDVGCSVGTLLGAFKEAGFARVRGLEPAPRARASGRKLFDVEIETGFLTPSFSATGLDLVCLVAVLEHLVDPLAALAPVAATLPPGGLLYLEVPAADRFDQVAGEWLGEFSLEHINFFGRTSLAAMLARLGFGEVASDYPRYPNGQIGLRSLFKQGAAPNPGFDHDLAPAVMRYAAEAERRLAAIESRLAPYHHAPVIVYGAGAHTARLLAQSGLGRCEVVFVADRNPNLVGKRLGAWPIRPPEAIALTPELPVIVSSYQSQAGIAAWLREHVPNPVITLYDEARLEVLK